MSEIKVYAMVVPTDEVWEKWMNNPVMENVMHEIDCVGIHPDVNVQHLFFRNVEDRKDAYNKIHAAMPDTLCAFDLRVAYIDTKYLKQQYQQNQLS